MGISIDLDQSEISAARLQAQLGPAVMVQRNQSR